MYINPAWMQLPKKYRKIGSCLAKRNRKNMLNTTFPVSQLTTLVQTVIFNIGTKNDKYQIGLYYEQTFVFPYRIALILIGISKLIWRWGAVFGSAVGGECRKFKVQCQGKLSGTVFAHCLISLSYLCSSILGPNRAKATDVAVTETKQAKLTLKEGQSVPRCSNCLSSAPETCPYVVLGKPSVTVT